MGVLPNEEEHSGEAVNVMYISQFFWVFVFLLASHLVLSSLANLFQDSPPRCAYTFQPRWILMM